MSDRPNPFRDPAGWHRSIDDEVATESEAAREDDAPGYPHPDDVARSAARAKASYRAATETRQDAESYVSNVLGEYAPEHDVPAIVETLLDHYEAAGDLALRLLAEEGNSAQIAAITREGRGYHRDWCARVFAPALDGLTGVTHERRLAQLVAVCDVYTWKLLHRDAGLSRHQVTIGLRELLEPLTSTAPGGG